MPIPSPSLQNKIMPSSLSSPPPKMTKYSRRRLTRRASALIALTSTAYLLTDTFLTFSPSHLSRGLLSYEECNVHSLHEPSDPIIPVYAASYPGSGSQMTHFLMEGLTGITAGEDWSARGDEYNLIAIKTHYPAREHQVEGAGSMDRVILLLRNPLKALPSHANYMYEHVNNFPDHTVRAPLDFWYDWRNNNFQKEIDLWRRHLEYWVEHYSAQNGKRLVISYERLVDQKMGPIETSRIAAFLGRSEGMETVSPEIVPCVWDKVVNYKHGARGTAGAAAAGGSSRRRKLLEQHATAEKKKNRNRRAKQVQQQKQEQNVISKKQTQDEAAGQTVHRKIHQVSQEDSSSSTSSSTNTNQERHLFEDPTHPTQSLRAGPKVEYRFSEEELIYMLNMLYELRDQYIQKGDEFTLVVILDSYIVSVEKKLKEVEDRKEGKRKGSFYSKSLVEK